MIDLDREIKIKIKIGDLRAQLWGMINHPYKSAIVDVIINHLDTSEHELGMEQFYKALQGEVPTSKYKVGDEVLVSRTNLNSYSISEEHTRNAGLFVREDLLRAEVLSVNPYQLSGIDVQFKYRSDKNEEREYHYMVREENLEPDEEILPDIGAEDT